MLSSILKRTSGRNSEMQRSRMFECRSRGVLAGWRGAARVFLTRLAIARLRISAAGCAPVGRARCRSHRARRIVRVPVSCRECAAPRQPSSTPERCPHATRPHVARALGTCAVLDSLSLVRVAQASAGRLAPPASLASRASAPSQCSASAIGAGKWRCQGLTLATVSLSSFEIFSLFQAGSTL